MAIKDDSHHTKVVQDSLIYGKKYMVSREREFIGIAEYMNDPIHGDGFFIEHKSGALEVCIVDEWAACRDG